MPDWQSLEELAADAAAFEQLQHVLLGLYAWEFFTTLNFDLDFLRRKKRFRWPMIFYFANRYLLLFALIGIVISFDSRGELDCSSLYIFNQFAGQASTGLASINLCLRTIAVYHNSKVMMGFLTLLILGHWSLLMQGVLIKAHWDDTQQTCVITETNTTILAACFIYSMCFDLIVLLLNAYRLAWKKKNTAVGMSRIGKLIFTDGLIYFIIAFVANLIATIFMILHLNSVMSVIFNVPAVVASTIVACRAVQRLSNYATAGPEIFTSSFSASGGVNFRPMGNTGNGVDTNNRRSHAPHSANVPGGVHVQMETFTRAESDPPTIAFRIDSERLADAQKTDRSSEEEKDLEYGRPDMSPISHHGSADSFKIGGAL